MGETLGMNLRRWSPSLDSRLGTPIAVVVLVLAWQLFGGRHGENRIIPAPAAIIEQVARDGGPFYLANLTTTLQSAVLGFSIGTLAAIGLAIAFVQVAPLERVLFRVALATYSIPMIAVGPLLQITLSGNGPKVGLAVLAVFFMTLVGALLGLRSADPVALDVIRAFGGGNFAQLRFVRLRAALPSIMAALQIAAPAALLGAVVAEYLGSESGLGVAMVAAQETLQIERTWALAALITACAGVAYSLLAYASSILLPRLSGVSPSEHLQRRVTSG